MFWNLSLADSPFQTFQNGDSLNVFVDTYVVFFYEYYAWLLILMGRRKIKDIQKMYESNTTIMNRKGA